jgi:hypothetical protein
MCTRQQRRCPLANELGKTVLRTDVNLSPLILTQLKMTYLHMETIPARTLRMAKEILLKAAASAELSAAALCTMNLMQVPKQGAVTLVDLYFDSKAKLLQTLLNQQQSSYVAFGATTSRGADGQRRSHPIPNCCHPTARYHLTSISNLYP